MTNPIATIDGYPYKIGLRGRVFTIIDGEWKLSQRPAKEVLRAIKREAEGGGQTGVARMLRGEGLTQIQIAKEMSTSQSHVCKLLSKTSSNDSANKQEGRAGVLQGE